MQQISLTSQILEASQRDRAGSPAGGQSSSGGGYGRGSQGGLGVECGPLLHPRVSRKESEDHGRHFQSSDREAAGQHSVGEWENSGYRDSRGQEGGHREDGYQQQSRLGASGRSGSVHRFIPTNVGGSDAIEKHTSLDSSGTRESSDFRAKAKRVQLNSEQNDLEEQPTIPADVYIGPAERAKMRQRQRIPLQSLDTADEDYEPLERKNSRPRKLRKVDSRPVVHAHQTHAQLPQHRFQMQANSSGQQTGAALLEGLQTYKSSSVGRGVYGGLWHEEQPHETSMQRASASLVALEKTLGHERTAAMHAKSTASARSDSSGRSLQQTSSGQLRDGQGQTLQRQASHTAGQGLLQAGKKRAMHGVERIQGINGAVPWSVSATSLSEGTVIPKLDLDELKAAGMDCIFTRCSTMTASVVTVAYSQFSLPERAHIKVQAAVAQQPELEFLEDKLRLMLAGHPVFDAKKPWKTDRHNLPQPPDEQVRLRAGLALPVLAPSGRMEAVYVLAEPAAKAAEIACSSHVAVRGEDETWYAEVRMLFSFTHPSHQRSVEAAFVRWYKIVEQRRDGGVLLKWEKEERRDGSLGPHYDVIYVDTINRPVQVVSVGRGHFEVVYASVPKP